MDSFASLLLSAPRQRYAFRQTYFTICQRFALDALFHPCARTILLCHCFIYITRRRYRNFNLLSIIYAFRPLLRSRLTLGGRTFPRKPQTFDGEVSRLPLATYAGILSSMQSTTASAIASARIHCSSTDTQRVSPSFGVRFEPR